VAGSATSECCASTTAQHGSTNGNQPHGQTDALAGNASQGIAPILSRPQPTSSPRPSAVAGADAAAPNHAGAAGGLVVSGMGLAALAGLAAWTGRRRPPDDDPSATEVGREAAEFATSDAPRRAPRLSVLRTEAADARKERRILPPT
jgi:hypothetical protein